MIRHPLNTKVQRLDRIKWIKNELTQSDSTIGPNDQAVIMSTKLTAITPLSLTRRDTEPLHEDWLLWTQKTPISLWSNLYTIIRSRTKRCPNFEKSGDTIENFSGQCPAIALLRGNT